MKPKRTSKALYKKLFELREDKTFLLHELQLLLKMEHQIYLNDGSISRSMRNYPEVKAMPPLGNSTAWRYVWTEKSPHVEGKEA